MAPPRPPSCARPDLPSQTTTPSIPPGTPTTAAGARPSFAKLGGVASEQPVFEVERWTSDNAEEIRLFLLRGDARGSAYVLGYNPKMIGHTEVELFLRDRNFHLAADTLHERVLGPLP